MTKSEAIAEAEVKLKALHTFCYENKIELMAFMDAGETLALVGACSTHFQIMSIYAMLSKDPDRREIMESLNILVKQLN
jgi:hypothetical protein